MPQNIAHRGATPVRFDAQTDPGEGIFLFLENSSVAILATGLGSVHSPSPGTTVRRDNHPRERTRIGPASAPGYVLARGRLLTIPWTVKQFGQAIRSNGSVKQASNEVEAIGGFPA